MPGTSRPRVGLTAWRRDLPTALGERTDLYTLAAEYVTAIFDAGALALIIPHGDDPKEFLDVIDGLILTGGGDLAAGTYGATDEGTSYDVNLAADEWESKLLQMAKARRMPVLGICRGMQLMAACAGGKLDQEISGAAGHPAMNALDPPGLLGVRHAIDLEPGSTLGRVYGQDRLRVNTIHHQAVTSAGDFRVAARCDAGHIEAMEMPGEWPALAVQWHPEKMQTAEELAMERKLFRHFVSLAEQYADAAKERS